MLVVHVVVHAVHVNYITTKIRNVNTEHTNMNIYVV